MRSRAAAATPSGSGCRQRLSTARLERVRLGDEVSVLVDERGGTLIIDDGDIARAELTHKVLKDPPLDGIYDENADLAKERRRRWRRRSSSAAPSG